MTMPEHHGDETLKSLSETLNRLSQKSLTISERDAERRNLAAIAAGFNGVSHPAAQKLQDALPGLADYGARWIAAKMLRDAGLKNEGEAEIALAALVTTFYEDKDPGSRQMASGLIRDLGIRHESLAVQAAVGISMLMGKEKDSGARFAEKNALMALGLKYEQVSPVAVEYVGKALLAEEDPLARALISAELRALGAEHGSQAAAAIRRIAKAGQQETDVLAAQHYAHDIAAIALQHPAAVPEAIAALAEGFRTATDAASLSGWSNALVMIGQKHPAPAVAALAELLEEHPGRDQRRMLYVAFKDMAGDGGDITAACVSALKSALRTEDTPFNRRLLIEGLMTGVRAEPGEGDGVRTALKEHLDAEKDPETWRFTERHLRSLGYVRPFAGNVAAFQPRTA